MTTPIEITPEIRQAVLEAECERLGHRLSTDNALTWADTRGGRVRGPAGQMPHLVCDRCDRVWIVVARDGRTYQQAERRFRERLLPTDPEALPPDPVPPAGGRV